MKKIILHEGWKMRPTDSDEWTDARVPGSVLVDLIACKRIDDRSFITGRGDQICIQNQQN